MNKPLILVVEDDIPVRNLITTTLKAHDYRFLTAANGESAVLEASLPQPGNHPAGSGTAGCGWCGSDPQSSFLVQCPNYCHQRPERGYR